MIYRAHLRTKDGKFFKIVPLRTPEERVWIPDFETIEQAENIGKWFELKRIKGFVAYYQEME